MTVFAISGVLLSAAAVYVVLKVLHFGESQTLGDQLLKAQADAEILKKKLLGYTQYVSCLDSSRQAAADLLKFPLLSVTREYVQVEKLTPKKHALKADATVIVKYAVEFAVALDGSAAGLAVSEYANGVGLKLSRPTVVGEPKIKTLSHQVVSALDLPDKNATLAELLTQFALQVKAYGSTLCAEEAVRAACKLRALEVLRDSLAKQPGVAHVPAIFAEFR